PAVSGRIKTCLDSIVFGGVAKGFYLRNVEGERLRCSILMDRGFVAKDESAPMNRIHYIASPFSRYIQYLSVIERRNSVSIASWRKANMLGRGSCEMDVG